MWEANVGYLKCMTLSICSAYDITLTLLLCIRFNWLNINKVSINVDEYRNIMGHRHENRKQKCLPFGGQQRCRWIKQTRYNVKIVSTRGAGRQILFFLPLVRVRLDVDKNYISVYCLFLLQLGNFLFFRGNIFQEKKKTFTALRLRGPDTYMQLLQVTMMKS